jgi:hypothetical protein
MIYRKIAVYGKWFGLQAAYINPVDDRENRGCNGETICLDESTSGSENKEKEWMCMLPTAYSKNIFSTASRPFNG